MASSLHSSPNKEISNDHTYTSLQPFIICSKIVKVDVESCSLSNITKENTNVAYRTKDCSIGLKKEDGFNVKRFQRINSYSTNKRNYEMIEEFNERNKNQDHILKTKEQNRSAHIDLIQRLKNGDNKLGDFRTNINFKKYERRSRNEITSRKRESNSIRFEDGKRSIHTRMHYVHNKDSFYSQIVHTDHDHGLIYDHKNHNRVRGQHRTGYGVSNSEARLCRDNNEDQASVDSRNVKIYGDDERRNVVLVTDRGERFAGRKATPPTPTLYSIHKAVVNSIRPFGIFVQMEGYQDHGLVHISQASNNEISTREDSEEAKVKALCTVANEGEMVWVKVISLKIEDFKTKTGCSMKYVNQEDGRDLDPNNSQLEQQSSQPATLQLKSASAATVLEEDDADRMTRRHRKGKERMVPRELNSGHMQSCGISRQLLATGSVGRGRAMVQPAWMKHGIGIGGSVTAASPVVEDQKQSSDLTERVTSTVHEGAAVIARLKEEKRRRKEERRRRRERRRGRSRRGEREERHKRRRNGEERHARRKKHRL